MRHKKKKHTLNRFTSWNKATLVSLVRSIMKYQSIKTTKGKALLARPVVDRLISDAKKGTLADKRRAFEVLGDHALVSLLFSDIAKRFPEKASGFTRIIGLGNRRGDNAEMVIFELTEIKKKEVKKPAKKKAAEGETEGAEESKEDSGAQPQEKKHRPSDAKKPNKNFLGGLKGIFKKERDSL